MEDERSELTEKIERCRRLAKFLTDEEMRQALEALADDYEARGFHALGRALSADREERWWQRRRSSLKFSDAAETWLTFRRLASRNGTRLASVNRSS